MPEFRPYLVGLGVAEVVEDVQSLLPCVVGLMRIPGGIVGVAQVVEGAGFVVTVLLFSVEGEGMPVAVGCLGIAA